MPKKGLYRPFPSLGNKGGACPRKRCDTCVCWSFSICRSKDDQREANRFRNFLLRDGYDRVQLSVYARVCRGPENVETHIRRLQKNLPPHGCVRLLQVTEKQYGRMRLLVGDMPVMEKEAATQLLLF